MYLKNEMRNLALFHRERFLLCYFKKEKRKFLIWELDRPAFPLHIHRDAIILPLVLICNTKVKSSGTLYL